MHRARSGWSQSWGGLQSEGWVGEEQEPEVGRGEGIRKPRPVRENFCRGQRRREIQDGSGQKGSSASAWGRVLLVCRSCREPWVRFPGGSIRKWSRDLS